MLRMGVEENAVEAEMANVRGMRASEIKKSLAEMSVGTAGVFEVGFCAPVYVSRVACGGMCQPLLKAHANTLTYEWANDACVCASEVGVLRGVFYKASTNRAADWDLWCCLPPCVSCVDGARYEYSSSTDRVCRSVGLPRS